MPIIVNTSVALVGWLSFLPHSSAPSVSVYDLSAAPHSPALLPPPLPPLLLAPPLFPCVRRLGSSSAFSVCSHPFQPLRCVIASSLLSPFTIFPSSFPLLHRALARITVTRVHGERVLSDAKRRREPRATPAHVISCRQTTCRNPTTGLAKRLRRFVRLAYGRSFSRLTHLIHPSTTWRSCPSVLGLSSHLSQPCPRGQVAFAPCTLSVRAACLRRQTFT